MLFNSHRGWSNRLRLFIENRSRFNTHNNKNIKKSRKSFKSACHLVLLDRRGDSGGQCSSWHGHAWRRWWIRPRWRPSCRRRVGVAAQQANELQALAQVNELRSRSKSHIFPQRPSLPLRNHTPALVLGDHAQRNLFCRLRSIRTSSNTRNFLTIFD